MVGFESAARRTMGNIHEEAMAIRQPREDNVVP